MSLNDTLGGLTDNLGGGLGHGLSQIKKFVMDNNIVGTSAGVAVGLAAKEGIQSLVNDVIMPAFATLFRYIHFDMASKLLPVGEKTKLDVINFIKQMIAFVITLAVSFLFVKLSFDYLLGIDTTKKDAEAAKKAAEMSNKDAERPNNYSTKELFGPLRGMY
jgi:large-conductance mechanosensitive channel